MEFTDEEKKQIVRQAVRIVHNTCVEKRTCCTCPFRDENAHCVFSENPDHWPLSNKTTVEWNYLDECEEEEND